MQPSNSYPMIMGPILMGLALSLALLSPLSQAGGQIKSGEHKLSVVELYTSEGCSSCPPADKLLGRLGSSKEADLIVPLAFHVDYWDYIGWQDPYAKAKYTARQRMMAKINGQRTIYTPEFVVDGSETRGSRKLTEQIKQTHRMPGEADITLNYADDEAGQLNATVKIENLSYQGDDTPEVYLAVFENGLSSSINAGENKGRTLKHDFVVRYISAPKVTKSGQQHDFSTQLNQDWNRAALGVAVVVKLHNSGQTLQALKGML